MSTLYSGKWGTEIIIKYIFDLVQTWKTYLLGHRLDISHEKNDTFWNSQIYSTSSADSNEHLDLWIGAQLAREQVAQAYTQLSKI